jgi:gas vesicle protein
MFNRRGQNVVEYSILIALVVGAAIAMQTYVKRGLQGRVYTAVKHTGGESGQGEFSFANSTLKLSGNQYEPYYQSSKAQINTDRNVLGEKRGPAGNITRENVSEQTKRVKDSYEKQKEPINHDE